MVGWETKTIWFQFGKVFGHVLTIGRRMNVNSNIPCESLMLCRSNHLPQPRVFAALEQGNAPHAFSPNIQHLGKHKHMSLKSCTNQYFYINNGSKDNVTGVLGAF